MNVRLIFVTLSLFLTSCSHLEVTQDDDDILTRREARDKNVGKLFGEEAFVFGDTKKDASHGAGIGVNSYLWRATLDTLSFMPLRTVDPFGGVILTEWHTASSGERLKVDVKILDKALRADGLKISVFRQRMEKGVWRDAPVALETATKLEDAILTRARQLKIRDLR